MHSRWRSMRQVKMNMCAAVKMHMRQMQVKAAQQE
jgi:hypothetical protein